MDGKRIILAAHRGDKKRFPENTLPAFEAAIKQRVDMIETDVHMTRDGALIIIHDRNLERTAGYEGFTNEVSLKEVKALDAGAWFGEEFSGTEIPTLEEFIALIKDTEVLINWELKDYPDEVGEELAFRSADALIDMIIENGLVERSMINSFSNLVLDHVLQKYGRIFPIHGQGIGPCKRTRDMANTPPEELYDWCCLYPNDWRKSVLDYPENFAYCTERGILPCICIADTSENYEKAIAFGCRMFTSNDIYAADEILRSLGVRE
jgi:glycerophosphoryl diester phosphodiesterase